MTKKSAGFVFDIETSPKEITPELTSLLNHKTRNVVPEKLDAEKQRYSFISPVYAKVISISTAWDDGRGTPTVYTFFDRNDEYSLLKSFVEYLQQWNGRYVHFNGLDFDVPFIMYKCAQYDISLPPAFTNLIRFRFDPHFDIMQALSSWGKFPVSLAEVLTTFGFTNSKDYLNDMDTLTFLLTASDEDIKKYNEADVIGTYHAFRRICNRF